MAWEQNSRFRRLPGLYDRPDFSSFKINEQCFIRKQHKCGKIFGASKSCFIACPSEDFINPILELMSEKLTKVGIEPIVAVKERAYGQDIFCIKICGKIIESRFCIVILDDTIHKKINTPNPNVYYEYGLMTSLRKHIVPLQKEGLKLAFNIQSYDTVKYNEKNIGTELDRAIKDAIKITESKEKGENKTSIKDKTIFRQLELAGIKLKDTDWYLSDVIDDTLLQGFGNYEKGFYAYLGKIDESNEFKDYLEDLAVVIHRTEDIANEIDTDLSVEIKKYKKLKKDINAQKKAEKNNKVINWDLTYRLKERDLRDIKDNIDDLKNKQELISMIYIGFIINPQLEKNKFLKKVAESLDIYKRYKLTYTSNNKMAFGDIKITFNTTQF